jgi:hypothetical protein
MKRHAASPIAPFIVLSVLGLAVTLTSCGSDLQAMDARQVEQQYGVAGAHNETVDTPDGPLNGTRVPITLSDGRQGYLFIRRRRRTIRTRSTCRTRRVCIPSI